MGWQSRRKNSFPNHKILDILTSNFLFSESSFSDLVHNPDLVSNEQFDINKKINNK